MEHSAFAVLGGDARYAILSTLLARDGYTVYVSGFDNCPEPPQSVVNTDAVTAASMAQSVILPIPPTKDGKTLWSPFGRDDMILDNRLCKALCNAYVYTGFADKLRCISDSWGKLKLRDYARNEIFLIRNARITAEAALMLAVQSLPKTLLGAKCLVTGFGRIGKFVSIMLRDAGARVYAAARKNADFALMDALAIGKVQYSALPDMARDFDLVINTADALVIGESIIARLEKSTVLIDLASAPGGIDFESAKNHEIKAIHALGLPGKYSPETAARIIKDTVLAMTEEELN